MCTGCVSVSNWSFSGVLGSSRAGVLNSVQSGTCVFPWFVLFGQCSNMWIIKYILIFFNPVENIQRYRLTTDRWNDTVLFAELNVCRGGSASYLFAQRDCWHLPALPWDSLKSPCPCCVQIELTISTARGTCMPGCILGNRDIPDNKYC